ncbi:hypothetical protein [Halomonas sp. M4R1S46]|uniref:hypothetical protein n=1 Tax=Halomonas sp. M4R1S46 TaxID=2982692 RepID=UPI0021E361FA|nr:hypothetical protein [Halomonas sp. M4R1S46]UYG07162.1 hypothetical protein OCT48_16245 [Halomonas sp. M4R1S46]
MKVRSSITPSVAVLAGRRIDAQDADVLRFPLAEAEHVAYKIFRCFQQECVEHLICSAACGADIIALEAAEKLAIPATLVLPFTSCIFREISVTDRPGGWGERFDHLVALARDRGGLIELGLDVSDERAFSAANDRIIQIASTTGIYRRLAFVVWEGLSRGQGDSTAEFLDMALSCGFERRVVLTRREH